MSPMDEFAVHMQELLATKASQEVFPFFSQYSVWLYISIAVFLFFMIYAAKKVQLIPKGFWAGGIEHLMDWFRRDVGYNTIGKDADRHMPFLMTIFFFILTSNLIGLIPGVHVATGTIGVTLALALISFIYYHYYGLKTKGFKKYILSFAPDGIAKPIKPAIWVIEVFSNFLRLVTLAVRLFANMYAGHLVLGAFAILTSVFLLPIIQGFTVAALGGVLWMVFLILMYLMELMVACIQAYVFALLSAVYIQLAVSEEH